MIDRGRALAPGRGSDDRLCCKPPMKRRSGALSQECAGGLSVVEKDDRWMSGKANEYDIS